MELDDLKNNWAEYDKKLSDNLRLNEELLRKLNLNTSRREMQKLLMYEILNITVSFFVIAFALSQAMYYINQPQFCIPSFILMGVTAIYLAFGIIRTKGFVNIDYHGSVVQAQKDILSLKRKTLLFRKYELILLPGLALPILPILFKVVHNINIYQHVSMFVVYAAVILGITYPILIWLYKYFYMKKFKSAEKLLAELEEFEKEN